MAITLVNKSHTATKRGPGRVHLQGKKRAKNVTPKGAGIGFEQRTNPAKNAGRKAKASMGARQFRLANKALKRMTAEAA
jgi:hypothetical protein